MNRETLVTLYDRLAYLVGKLPGGLQKPILHELEPIREVFLNQRPARLMVVGDAGGTMPEFFHRIGNVMLETGESENGWRTYRVAGVQGEMRILDAREDTPDVTAALAAAPADVVVYLKGDDGGAEHLESASARVAGTESGVPLVAVAYGDDAARLAALLRADRNLSLRRQAVREIAEGEAIVEDICTMLPRAAQLEFARMLGARRAQAQIAASLLKSFAAVCGVIGLQPIPLADMPILTSLQMLMVGLIVYVSGKTVNAKLITEFLGALGLNIGAGILFRESARAIIKVIPLWGNAVSGFVAGAGTYAVGRAAIAYFIEETPIAETKKLFQRLLPGWDAFRRRRLPGLTKKTPPPLPPPGNDQ